MLRGESKNARCHCLSHEHQDSDRYESVARLGSVAPKRRLGGSPLVRSRSSFGQAPGETFVVAVIVKDLPASLPAADNVSDGAGLLNSRQTRHRATIPMGPRE